MRQVSVNPQIFTDNRQRFVKKMKAGSIAIFNSNDELPTNGDALHPFRQNSDLYWLTGIFQ
jgi:Xaa-Pro aminopeptidase